MSGTKKEVKRVARGMNPITRKPRTYDPLPRAVFFSLSLGLCLPFSTLPLPDTAAFLSVAFLPRSASRPTTAAQGRLVGSIRLLSPAFLLLLFSFLPSLFLSLSLASFLFLASFLHSFRPSRFSCILTRLHARGFAVRPDYPSLPASHLPLGHPNVSQPPSFLPRPGTIPLARLSLFLLRLWPPRVFALFFSRSRDISLPPFPTDHDLSLFHRHRFAIIPSCSSGTVDREPARLTVARISASLGRPHTTSAGQQIPRPSNYPRAEFRPLVFRFKCPCAGFFRGATARATALSFPLFLCPPFSACLFSPLFFSVSLSLLLPPFLASNAC